MVLQYPEFNAFSPTPGQKLILNAIGRTQLPFEAIKKIKTIKGKDLLWIFVLKALPKVYNTICSHCNKSQEEEKFNKIISNHLEKFSKQWNTPLNTIQLPKHLSQYKTTLNTFL
ncbi:hypothetical protein ACTFIU_002820 [Dictyostelium citrinum]